MTLFTRCRQFGFVDFVQSSSIEAALALNGTMLSGRPIRVTHSKSTVATPQEGMSKRVADLNALIVSKLGLASPLFQCLSHGSRGREDAPVSRGLPAPVRAMPHIFTTCRACTSSVITPHSRSRSPDRRRDARRSRSPPRRSRSPPRRRSRSRSRSRSPKKSKHHKEHKSHKDRRD